MFKCSWHIRTKASILPTYKRVAPEFNESSFYLSGEVGSVDITAVTTTTTTAHLRIYYALYHNQNRIIEITKTEWTIRSAE